MAREYRDTANKKIIWARIGMFVEVSNEEYERFKEECGDSDMPPDLYELFKSEGKFGGDSYVPEFYFNEKSDDEVYVEGEI